MKGRTGDYFRRHRNSQQPLKWLSRARAVRLTSILYILSLYDVAGQDLRRLERANRGDAKPFMSLLRHAYGRTGKLRHELLHVCIPVGALLTLINRPSHTSYPTQPLPRESPLYPLNQAQRLQITLRHLHLS